MAHRNHYILKCLLCGQEYEDAGKEILLACRADHSPSLLRAVYANTRFTVKESLPGMFRYMDWLPVKRTLKNANRSAVYQSQGLARLLGLENLFIIFNGYWPEKGAFMETCSFKELEAPAVCGRLPKHEDHTIVVSSAGNTGRAFMETCSKNGIPAIAVIPESGLPSMWTTGKINPCVKLAVLTGNVDYLDAIELGNTIAGFEGYFPEGGARNAGRRDGMGTALLSAVETLGVLPQHYFQAVGSGTGGIAAWETSLRLMEDGRFGSDLMRLHLSQNSPFTPMVDAWSNGAGQISAIDEQEAKRRIGSMRAGVLSNRKPPYSIVGGVRDALTETSGRMYAVSNQEAERAGAIFLELEKCDIDPAAEVAVASLFQAVESGEVGKKDLIMLNVTGGGLRKLGKERKITRMKPDLVFPPECSTPEAVSSILLSGNGHRASKLRPAIAFARG